MVDLKIYCQISRGNSYGDTYHGNQAKSKRQKIMKMRQIHPDWNLPGNKSGDCGATGGGTIPPSGYSAPPYHSCLYDSGDGGVSGGGGPNPCPAPPPALRLTHGYSRSCASTPLGSPKTPRCDSQSFRLDEPYDTEDPGGGGAELPSRVKPPKVDYKTNVDLKIGIDIGGIDGIIAIMQDDGDGYDADIDN